jgi:hypothetical protein
VRLLIVPRAQRANLVRRVQKEEALYRRHLVRLLGQRSQLPVSDHGSPDASRFGIEATILHVEAHLKCLELCQRLLTGAEQDAQTTGAEGAR